MIAALPLKIEARWTCASSNILYPVCWVGGSDAVLLDQDTNETVVGIGTNPHRNAVSDIPFQYTVFFFKCAYSFLQPFVLFPSRFHIV